METINLIVSKEKIQLIMYQQQKVLTNLLKEEKSKLNLHDGWWWWLKNSTHSVCTTHIRLSVEQLVNR